MASGQIFSRQWLTEHIINPTSRRNIRPDIQGLRMLAVVAVVLDHLLHWPSGGFVGVDVFFVISGFLITGILLREHEKTGHISFVGFYKRRIRRIVPAATVVILSTVLAAYLIFNKARFAQTAWDAFWAFFFGANWHFAVAGTGYFQASGPVSPLQHFWSLSVEEQFYFVWPWVMLGVLALAASRGSVVRRRTLVGVVMFVFVLASLAWAFFESASNPTIAYFSTFTRAWELGIGALVAIASPWWGAIGRSLRPILGWIGLLGIIASFFVINDSLPFPAPWALLPVLATSLVVVAGTGGEQRFLFPLTNPISFYVGNISYSLYLWHFPVIVFVAALIDNSLQAVVLSVALMVVLSVLSYHLIEAPLQKSPWLSPKNADLPPYVRRRESRRSWAEWWDDFKPTYSYGLLAAASMALVLVTLSTFAPTTSQAGAKPVLVAASPSSAPSDGSSPIVVGPEVAAVQDELAAGASLSTWPVTDPTVDYVIEHDMIPDGVGPCGDINQPPLENCTWGSETASKTAVLVGDSVAMAWVPALLPIYAENEWKLVILGRYGCPFIDIAKADTPERQQSCAERKEKAVAEIAEIKPDLVILSDTYILPPLQNGQGTATAGAWGAGLGRMLAKIAPNAGQIIALSPPPSDANVNIEECYTPTSAPADCMVEVSAMWRSVAKAEREAIAKVPSAAWIDTSSLFCVQNFCPAVTPGLPIKRDATHVTMPFAERISNALRETIDSGGDTR